MKEHNALPKSAQDQLARQQRDGGEVHPDADLLTAFCENVLGDAERERLLEHVSRCGECREVLFLIAPDWESEAPRKEQPERSASEARWTRSWRKLMPAMVTAVALAVVGSAVLLNREHTSERTEKSLDSEVSSRPMAMPLSSSKPGKESSAQGIGTAAPRKAEVARNEKAGSGTSPLEAVRKKDDAQSQNSNISLNLQAAASLHGSIEAMGSTTKYQRFGAMPAPLAAVGGMPKTANLVGNITDPTGAAVVGAKITVRDMSTNAVRPTLTSPEGKYTASSLLPGMYEVTITAPGFATLVESGLDMAANQTVRLDAKLKIGTQTETVEVASEVGAIKTETSSKGDVVAPVEIAQMPLNGRDPNDLVFNVPGVMPQEEGGKGTSYTTGGARSDQSNVVIEGLNNTNPRDAGAEAAHWRITNDGALERSSGNGAWSPVLTKAKTKFRVVSVIANHVWAGGDRGVLYHSQDSGMHWLLVNIVGRGSKPAAITAIRFRNTLNGQITTDDGAVWKTFDGGAHWSK